MKKIAAYITLVFVSCTSLAQTTVNHNMTFSTSNQNMWGPGNAFNLNKDIQLFNLPWNFGFGPVGGIYDASSVGLGQWGAEVSAGSWGSIGARFYIQGVTGGTVAVDYPIQTDITFPTANTFNRGEWITINTDYTVENGWKLETQYPNAGEAGLEFNFDFHAFIHPKLCAYSCTPSTGFPNIDVNVTENFDIFYISPNLARYPCGTASYTLPGGDCPVPGFGYCTNPIPCPPVGTCLPTLCEKALLPVSIPDNGFGFTGELDLPNVVTTDNLGANKCLSAKGEDDYLTVDIELLKFMSNFIPGPVGEVMGNLSGSYSFGPLTFSYNIFSASFVLTTYNKQSFSFCPNVYGTFQFPNQVEYQEVTPVGATVNTGQSQSVRVEIGNDLLVRYPCNYEFMDVDIDYDLENDFTNHTYDSLAFDFVMSALGFSLTMPAQPIFDGIWLPRTCCCAGCLPWPLDDECWGPICVGGYWIVPPITIPAINIAPTPNPLVSLTVPIGSIQYDWVDKTWELEGFNTPQNGGSFMLDPMQYLATSTGQDVDCYGNNTGQMDVTVINGNAPYTFYWPDGSNTVSAIDTVTNNNLLAGNNYVVVEDVNGCQAFTDVVINQPGAPLDAFNSVISHVDCNGSATGSVSVSMTGGTTPYIYTWTPNVSSTGDAINLSAGTYDLTVTDARNCTYTDQFVITEPTALTASITTTNVLCNGGNSGSATVSASGGSYPYTYLWSSGAITQTATGLTAGNHSVTVTDSRGCTFVVPVTITEPTSGLATTIAMTPIDCYGGSNGTIDLTVSGGTAPYTYNWYNGSYQLLSAHTQDLANQQADLYRVEITDNNGCQTKDSILITGPAAALAIDLVDVDSVLCFGGSTGAIDINVTGGTPGYLYTWSNAQAQQDLNGLAAGSYSVTVDDANGCAATATYEVLEPTAIVFSKTTTDVLCNGDATGAIDITVTGGTLPYSYLWNGNPSGADLTGLTAGNYTVQVTDKNGCGLTDLTAINQPAALGITAVSTAVNCYGGSDGTLSANVTGGVAPYSYQWNNSASVILSNATPNLVALDADSYTLNITDVNGCAATNTFAVTEPIAPIALSSVSSAVLCYGGSTGAINLNVTGGTGPYMYAWSNTQSVQDLVNVPQGTYTVTVEDANGCTETHTDSVSEPSAPLSVVTTKQDVKCMGYATGIAAVTVSGGTGPYALLWSNGEDTPVIDSLAAGAYTVNVGDANGCLSFGGVLITQPTTFPTFTYTSTDASCYGYKDGSFTIDPLDGITPYTIQFGDTVTGQYNNLVNSYSKYGLGAGIYHVLLQDANGCEFNQYIPIFQPDSVWGTTIVTDVSCYNGADGAIDLTSFGGTLPHSFEWSNSSINEDIVALAAGWYSVEITDANGCVREYSEFVDQPEELFITPTVSHVSCKDNSDGSIEVFVEGGTEDYSYLWSTTEITESIFNLAPGIYTITVTDAQGCTKQDSIFVNANDIACLDIATAFTPDGDGINDTWYLENMELYPDAVVKIFNKWGNLLYETRGTYVPWNGYYNGNRLPAATYYYIIDLGDGTPAYTGPVTIVIKQ